MGRQHRRIGERLVEWLTLASGGLAIAVVVLIFIFLVKEGLPVFKTTGVTSFLFGRDWYPVPDEVFGILPLILGSLLVTAGATAIALPIGIACAVYLAEIAPVRIREVLKPTVEVLAGIPSVVIGFIGLVVLAPYVKLLFQLNTGLTALTGAIMLGFMAMPTIISISEDAIVAVPREYRDAALALGASKWQTIAGVVVPAAKSGIIAAVMLGVGRAIGETMTVLMVTGNAAIIPHSFLQPVRTMTATIAAEMGETVQGAPHYYALFAIGIVLFLITLIINVVADLALRRSGQR